MILPKMFPKPAIKSLSGQKRNWAKSHKLYLTADNRINAKMIIREMKFLDFEIRQIIPLVRSHKVGSYALKRLQKMRTLLEYALIDQVALPFDVRKASCGPYKKRGPSVTIDGWDGNCIPEDFRVDTRDELWTFLHVFNFQM